MLPWINFKDLVLGREKAGKFETLFCVSVNEIVITLKYKSNFNFKEQELLICDIVSKLAFNVKNFNQENISKIMSAFMFQ